MFKLQEYVKQLITVQPERNLKDCQRDVKSQCYKTYVHPIVEYASVAWDPVGEGKQQLRHQIEMVQRRAARFVTGDWRTTSSVSAMINTLQWQTLEQRRLQSRLIFLHKYCYKAIDIKEPIAIRARNLNTNYQAIHSRPLPQLLYVIGTHSILISATRQKPQNSKRN